MEFIKKLAFARCSLEEPWSLHGLWLDYTNESYPAFCSDVSCEFDNDDILPLYPKCWDAKSVRCHEWQKHGSCFYDLLNYTQQEYLNETENTFSTWVDSIPLDSTSYVLDLGKTI
uniref:Uncharacterized protein n=1 Tax=Megaviridae environmental sample TaxID=1737588 RepID=A0A5J6VIY5_9VIRU|nr:MAG: hypothetical protein [Megaviridae environmental sample]